MIVVQYLVGRGMVLQETVLVNLALLLHVLGVGDAPSLQIPHSSLSIKSEKTTTNLDDDEDFHRVPCFFVFYFLFNFRERVLKWRESLVNNENSKISR